MEGKGEIISSSRIAILGASGFIGSNIIEDLHSKYELAGHTRDQFDVRDQSRLKKFLKESKAEFVINCVGKVAGVQGNLDRPADLLISNVTSSASVMEVCHELEIQNLVQFASACVYPLNANKALNPSDLNTGPIEESSKSYASAKLMTLEATSAFNREYGYSWTTFIPTNLYGPGDWNVGVGGHVMSSLLSRFLMAKKNKESEVVVWGDGSSIRNFLHVKDLVNAVELRTKTISRVDDVINLAGEVEISIGDLAKKIAVLTEYQGSIRFDKSKPNGARRKMLDDRYWRSFGWQPSVDLNFGIKDYIDGFEEEL
jgi:GDP-L-fucose synthase